MRFALAALLAATLCAQERIAFEVASVKPTAGGGEMVPMRQAYSPGGQLTITNMPLYWLIATAYNVPFDSKRLSGVPAWTRSERFDIQANAPEPPANGTSAVAREKRTRLMLQALLADRFGLVMRCEVRELPVYALVAPRQGSKLKGAVIDESACPERPADSGLYCHHPDGGVKYGLHGAAIDMGDLASLLEALMVERPVIDQTGIQGLYNVQTGGWATEAVEDSTRPSLFRLLEEELGLKLEARKAGVEVYVVEQISRPTEN
jgi:uncharacterized protein (TIGR03435 family)